MMGARSTGPTVFNTKCAIAVSAPVLPALTMAPARPSFTRSMAMRMEESLRRRIASRGCSDMPTTVAAGCTVSRARTAAGTLASAGSMTEDCPTRINSRVGSVTSARSAPGMHSGAPLSPLITSTATDGMRYERKAQAPAQQLFFGFDFGRFFNDALAAIKTVRSDAVTQVGFTGLRIDRQSGLRQSIVRTMHAALGRRFTTFLNGHGTNPLGRLLLAFQQFAQLCKRFLNLRIDRLFFVGFLSGQLHLAARTLASFRMPRHVRQRQQDLFIDEVAHTDAVGLDQKHFQPFGHPVGSVVVADQRDARFHLYRPAHGLHASLTNYFGRCAHIEVGNCLPLCARETYLAAGVSVGLRQLMRNPGQFGQRDREIDRGFSAYQGVDGSASGPAQ